MSGDKAAATSSGIMAGVAMARACVAFVRRDFADPDPPPCIVVWFCSHPPLKERVDMALGAASPPKQGASKVLILGQDAHADKDLATVAFESNLSVKSAVLGRFRDDPGKVLILQRSHRPEVFPGAQAWRPEGYREAGDGGGRRETASAHCVTGATHRL